jgi:hypothetical protein
MGRKPAIPHEYDPATDFRTKNSHEYDKRLRDVAWYKAPACGLAAGVHHAKCVLEPGHPGVWHEGNGNDGWGPIYVTWKA